MNLPQHGVCVVFLLEKHEYYVCRGVLGNVMHESLMACCECLNLHMVLFMENQRCGSVKICVEESVDGGKKL